MQSHRELGLQHVSLGVVVYNSAHHKHLQNLATISPPLESLPRFSQVKLTVQIPIQHCLFFFMSHATLYYYLSFLQAVFMPCADS